MALTNRQRAFIEHYLTTWNATQAARQAGYSVRTANEQGARLLANVSVRAAIAQRLEELKLGADEVLVRLSEQARSVQAEYIRDNGTVDLKRMRADGKAHLIKGTKWDQAGHLVVEFHDAQAALVHLGKHHKLFVDRLEHSGEGGKAIKVEYVNDWRGTAADAPSGPAVGEGAGEALQLAGGGAPLAEDDPGDGDSG